MKKVVLFFSFFILSCSVQADKILKNSKPNCSCKSAQLISAPTDYFRSVASGFWNVTGTWESSPDNISWSAATSTPTTTARNIYIRAGHFVNINSNQDIDQVYIESGGTLSHLGSLLTIYDDPSGDDVIVESGGVFTLASAGNPPLFNVPTATININTGGVLRVSTTGLTSAIVGANANNYIYEHASVLEYTPSLAFASSGVTYFPNVNAATIPIFRTTNNLGLIGGNNPTVINGIFEANGTITFSNNGPKTFRNGIIGTGNITSDPASGKFIINGTTAVLGGSGSLTLPAIGMDIGPAANVTVISDKSVTGNIALLTNALITLGAFNLTMTGDITGGSATSHVVTDGSGKLIINNIAGPVPRIFPVGANSTTINPMAIFNGSGFNYGVRVETGINPAIAVPVKAVNRTWFVTPNGGNPGTVNTNFFYAAGDGNAGFNYTANLELGLNTGVWNVIQTGLIPAGSYQVATTVSSFGNNIEAPLVLANLGAILAAGNSVSVNYFTGIKQNGNHLLKWKLACNNTPAVTMVLERSTNGVRYAAVFYDYATALRCEQPFVYTDDDPAAGINYYRLKITDGNGKIYYSTIVSLINAVTGIDVLQIAPNPVTGQSFDLKMSAAKNQPIEIFITDMWGRSIQQNTFNLMAGFNVIPVHIAQLPKGVYQLHVKASDGQTKVLRIVLQ